VFLAEVADLHLALDLLVVAVDEAFPLERDLPLVKENLKSNRIICHLWHEKLLDTT
jgi:hypothetical protein